MRYSYAVAAALCLATSLPACAASYEITIQNMKFGPAPKQLNVGDTLTWKNADFLRHTATARNGAFDLMLAPGAAATVTLRKPGAILVFCRYHPDMTLTLSVAK